MLLHNAARRVDKLGKTVDKAPLLGTVPHQIYQPIGRVPRIWAYVAALPQGLAHMGEPLFGAYVHPLSPQSVHSQGVDRARSLNRQGWLAAQRQGQVSPLKRLCPLVPRPYYDYYLTHILKRLITPSSIHNPQRFALCLTTS